MITVFQGVTDKIPKYHSPETIIGQIRSCSIQKRIDELRAEKDKAKNDELKKRLPSILFAGKFKARGNKNIEIHSGLCILDFDHLPDVNAFKIEISKEPFIYAAFISPNGDGLKVVCRIPAVIEKHEGHYRGLMKHFNLPHLDTTSKNIERVCFASVDADVYFNPDCSVFETYIEKEKPKPVAPTNNSNGFTDYSKINNAVKMINNSIDGEKHGVLLKAARLAGGYIAGGIVDETEAIRILETTIHGKGITDFKRAQDTIRDGIENGKLMPIEELEREFKQVAKSNGIQPIDEVWENMKHTFTNGKKRGETTYFGLFDENFKWKAGEITLIIGRPNSGKTEFALQLMLMRSIFNGWKWGVFSPENYPPDEFYDTLIHAYIGKTTDPYFGQWQMSMAEYEKGYQFIREHFFYVYPDKHSIEELDSNFLHLINDKGISGTFIDPFNQLEIEYGERQDIFLSNFLRERKRLSVKYNLHDVISAHPKTMSRNKNGEYEIPDMYDISGGSMWGNKVDNIIVVHRPNFLTNPMDTVVEIHVRKVKKQKLVGIPGLCTFTFQRKTNRYYVDGINPLEAKPPMPVQKEMNMPHADSRIEPNRDKEPDFTDYDENNPPF